MAKAILAATPGPEKLDFNDPDEARECVELVSRQSKSLWDVERLILDYHALLLKTSVAVDEQVAKTERTRRPSLTSPPS